MKRILFDSDVLLDVLSQRQPFFITSSQALNTVIQNQVEGYISGHAVTNIFYILRRQAGKVKAQESIAKLLENLRVASVTEEVIKSALNSAMSDFEDAVTSEAANAIGIEIIVTRNLSDFSNSSVPAMIPEEFLKAIS
ncbi:MAG: PIN domain-containing protein [Chroococcales cyanobacterium]